MENKDQLKVERIGGFGGFGLPGSHLKSMGNISIADLPPDDLHQINRLFQGNIHLNAPKTDGFRYRITMWIGDTLKTIEVPEENVPVSIRNSVKDTLE